MFYAASIISLIILIPGTILVSSLIVRRYGTPWRLLFLGALAFLVGEILRNTIMGAVTGTDFYRAVAEMPSPIPLIFFFAFSLAIFQFAVRCGGFWAAFRYGGDKARPRVGAMTFSVGFSGIDAIFTLKLDSRCLGNDSRSLDRVERNTGPVVVCAVVTNTFQFSAVRRKVLNPSTMREPALK